jgi:hypothetical protein
MIVRLRVRLGLEAEAANQKQLPGILCSGHHAKGLVGDVRCVERGVKARELRMIEGVMCVDTEGELHPLMERNIAHQAYIPNVLPWAVQPGPRRVAKSIGRCDCKRRRVEPLLHGAGSARQIRVSHLRCVLASGENPKLIADGESVVLDSGTTTLYVARELRARRNVVVFTFSLAVLEELTSAEGIRVELTGGVYRASSHDLIGHAVAKSLSSIFAGTVIFGAAAISFTRGVMVHDPDTQHELLQAGRRKVLVVDSSKIGAEATYRLCGIEDCDLVVTDRGISPDDLARLRKVTEVEVAE